ncbi:D-glucuronyl C5-epimerase family protein [Streptomyces sp. NPDC057638]|uniref:D-glucuronyl C5-epimerase family protein n=1 Tax=Streptomyces sp. NPDC057638 TaxID=3346190 RepID=UPI00369C99EB
MPPQPTDRRTALRALTAAVAATGLSGGGFLVGRASRAPDKDEGAARPSGLPFAFRTRGFGCRTGVREGLRPWRARRAAQEDRSPHDASGVRMFTARGKLHDHPVGQIQYGLENLASHRVTGDAFFLRRARAQADRVVSRRHERRGAWFFPYPFPFRHDVHTGLDYQAPWYSGMAQGEALSLFSQLATYPAVPARDRARYRAAADGAFASLLAGDGRQPWVVARDASHHLWIHEYPVDAPGTSDYTYNGFMFAALGLWDYHAMTGNPLAEQLFDGSLTTLDAEFTTLRNPGWLSHYCRTHTVPTTMYHPVHIDLLLQLCWLSGSHRFAGQADVLMDDHPKAALGKQGGEVALAEGNHTLRRFSKEGELESTRTLSLTRPARATASHRSRIPGGSVHYLLADGPGAGWYVEEEDPTAVLRGVWCALDYSPARRALLPAGVSVVCREGGAGSRVTTRTRTVTSARDTRLSYDRRAVVDGRPMVRLADGRLRGWWAPVAQLRLSATA